jgi:hypothetical protein
MSGPLDPFAPPRSVEAEVRESADAQALRRAGRRAWRAFGLWLVGYSAMSGSVSASLEGEALRRVDSLDSLPFIIVRNLIGGVAPHIAILAACFGAATFAHHHRDVVSRPAAWRAVGPMFVVTPAAAAVAAVVALSSAALAMRVVFGLGRWAAFAGILLTTPLSEVELALVKTCVDAILLGPLAIFGLSVLTKHVGKFGITLVIVWITVLGSLTGIDTMMFHPFEAGEVPAKVRHR